MIPLLISQESLKVLVIGGGPVALRKCMHFKGADMTVIAEEIISDIEKIAGSVIKRRATPSEISGMMNGFDIVVAATNDATMNSEIKDEALRRGLYVNSAHGGGNISIPSVLRRDDYLVTVSSEGRVPAFPPFVIEELDSFLDSRFDVMLSILAESRKMCAGKGTQPERSEFLRRVARDPEVNALAKAGNVSAALERVENMGVPQ